MKSIRRIWNRRGAGFAASCGLVLALGLSLGIESAARAAQDQGGAAPQPATQEEKETRERPSRARELRQRVQRRPRPQARIPEHDSADEVELGDGLVIVDLKVGDGEELESGDRGVFEYTGWIRQTGKLFNTNRRGNEARLLTSVPGRLIDGWNRGLLGMREGGWRKLIVPADLAYGEDGYRDIGVGSNQDLVFEVELIKILHRPEIDLGEARRVKDGALVMDLQVGEGAKFEPNGFGTFHVTQWNDEGRILASTWREGEPSDAGGSTLRGWSYYARGMRPGGKRAVYVERPATDRLGGDEEETDQAAGDPGQTRTETVGRTYLIEAIDVTAALKPPQFDKADLTAVEDGLKYLDLKPGDGRVLPRYAYPELHFTGWRSDGTVFDTTRNPGGETRIITPDFDIQAWGAGLAGMRVGGERLIVVPPEYAYGEEGDEELRIAPNERLLIRAELVAYEMPLFLPPEALEDEKFMEQWNKEYGEGSFEEAFGEPASDDDDNDDDDDDDGDGR